MASDSLSSDDFLLLLPPSRIIDSDDSEDLFDDVVDDLLFLLLLRSCCRSCSSFSSTSPPPPLSSFLPSFLPSFLLSLSSSSPTHSFTAPIESNEQIDAMDVTEVLLLWLLLLDRTVLSSPITTTAADPRRDWLVLLLSTSPSSPPDCTDCMDMLVLLHFPVLASTIPDISVGSINEARRVDSEPRRLERTAETASLFTLPSLSLSLSLSLSSSSSSSSSSFFRHTTSSASPANFTTSPPPSYIISIIRPK